MFRTLKEKLAVRRQTGKAISDSQHWKRDERMQACLQAMRGSCTVAPMDLHEAAIAVVNIALREDHWTLVEEIPEDFLPEVVYLVWDNEKLPVLKAWWELAQSHLEDVTAVSGQTFLVAQTMDRIVHMDNCGCIRIYSVA